MTAPAARIAEIVAEGRRLETGCGYEDGVDLAMARGAFYRQHGPALLAVAEAADKREANLRAAAREALDVLTRLADSAAYWSDYDVPVGLVAEVDAAKARLAGVLGQPSGAKNGNPFGIECPRCRVPAWHRCVVNCDHEWFYREGHHPERIAAAAKEEGHGAVQIRCAAVAIAEVPGE